MNATLLLKAASMFAVTNIDDLLLLAVFFGRARGRVAVLEIVAGQYLGFAAILAVSVLGALGAGLLPETVIPYLGLLPLALGLRAGWTAWRGRHEEEDDVRGAGLWSVAAVTFANGGDNIGVYVPVFAVAGTAGMVGYLVVFLAGTALWCAAGRFLAGHPVVGRALSRRGHVILPLVLVAIGVTILVEGGAFGL
ncbi:cadmium resistance transporter [Saccharothrix violaceirubra]|uniref:Cadmium resistance protein CadD (Predicted permease) n=1 Tax=Saccharothrix violaceirubra TaxID=413306 RepID=A0A7W7T276_9PSEU|nr:cadmium resistance transporter [Saccharothrix violaceirubra]MBB4963990.1 cadmium resistance protein CadD (predicted permease) [Saccharothrix violaceirubra]